MSRVVLGALGVALACGCGGAQAPVPASAAESTAEVTIGVPVSNVDEAHRWYGTLIGRDVETIAPVEGIVELHVAPGAWLQLFAVEGEMTPSPTIVRVATADIDAEARRLAEAGIEIGDITRIPGVVAFAELVDPFGNAVGLYQVLPAGP